MSQSTTTTGDGAFPEKGSAVVRDRCQSSKCGSLFPGDGADLGHFCDQRRAGNRADPRDRADDEGNLGQVIVARDGLSDPVFQFLDQAVAYRLQSLQCTFKLTPVFL